MISWRGRNGARAVRRLSPVHTTLILALAVGFIAPVASAFADTAVLDLTDAEARIVNGTVTFDYAAVGALVQGSSPSSAELVCTGTLIGCRTFITAAHCVCDSNGAGCQGGNAPSPTGRFVYLPHAGFIPVSQIYVHPQYQFLSRFSKADVALIHLAVDASGVPPMGIADDPTPVGSSGTIVGYGRSGGGTKNLDYGIKRVGDVSTALCNQASQDGLICWNFLGPGSNTCNGDSGGPLFADFGSGPVVAGLTSGGASATCLANDHSFDTDVGYYHDWVVTTAADATLGAASCGSGSQVGAANNLVDGAIGSLGGCHVTPVHEFLVGMGSSQLRVAMNAKDDGFADFDLYVAQGEEPIVDANGNCSNCDCKQDDTGQFGFCQFANPAGGRWFVRVRRYSGTGEYQLTVNDRNTLPSVCGNNLHEPGEDCDLLDDDSCPGLCEVGCACPAPQCLNGVQEEGEECDVGADAACPGRCNSGCTCDCLTDDLTIDRVIANADRLFLKGEVDNTGGEYTGFNPSDGFRLYLSDGVDTVAIFIPAGDAGWDSSDCERRRFKWKGNLNGITFVRITDMTDRDGTIRLKVKGVAVPGAGDLAPGPLGVEAHLDGTCTTGTSP
jgi:hypothetical protein